MGLPNGTAIQVPDIVLRPKPWHSFLTDHPIGFWFIFWGEFAERCSYYGMRAILAIYMADVLDLGKSNAGTYMSFFIAACYFLPLVGGYVADNYLGKYQTIILFSLPYILGHVILGIENIPCLVIALALLAMGSGVIKPNISTLMGMTYDQQRPGQEQLRSNAFAMFYMAINIGAGLSQIAMPLIRNEYGYWVAFLFPAALMVLAFAIFAVGKPFYAREVISQTPSTDEEWKLKIATLIRIGGLFVLIMFFWAIFDQSASTWIFFADTYMDANLLGLTVDAEQIQALNAWLIVLLVPVVTALWNYLNLRGMRVRATDKMVVGFLLTAACMGVMALAASLTGPTEHEGRLVLKDGRVTVSQGRMVFPEGVVEVRNARVVIDNGRITLEGGQVLTAGNPVPADLTAAAFPAHRVQDKEGGVEIKHGKFFVQGGAILVKQMGKKAEEASNLGTVTVEKGKAVAVTGKLTLADGKVQGPEEAVVLQPDEYTTSANKVGIWWQALAYLLVTVAEILISVTGLELAFVAAPQSMKSFVTGMWLFTVGMANLLINAPVTRLYAVMPAASYFAMLAGTLLVVAVLFVFVAQRFNRLAAQAAAAEKPPEPGESSTAIKAAGKLPEPPGESSSAIKES